MYRYKDLAVLQFKNIDNWIAWLEKNHSQLEGIWLKIAKKNTQATTISYEDAREGALIYGWIDSLPNKLDETYYLLKMTPRRPRSVWSRINVEICEKLISEGKMMASGLREIEAAKADGRWQRAYESPSQVEVPEDFKEALSRSKKAQNAFETMSKTNRFSMIYQINDAKRPQTRTTRIEKFIKLLENSDTRDNTKKDLS